MIKKLDNRFSLSNEEFNETLKKLDNPEGIQMLLEDIKKFIIIIRSYLYKSPSYDDWIKIIYEKIDASIPTEIKNKCNSCNGKGIKKECKICKEFYDNGDLKVLNPIIAFVDFIELNNHLFTSKELKFSLTQEFFSNFKIVDGQVSFDAKRFDKVLNTNILMLVKEKFSKMDSLVAIDKINDILEELESHKTIADVSGREMYQIVEPQIKLLKTILNKHENKLKFLKLEFDAKRIKETEAEDENLKTSSNNSNDESPYDEYENVFRKSMSFQTVIEHFEIFTIKNSQNGKPFLTNEQLDLFIRRAFCGEINLPKQKFNQIPKGEKFIIQYRFREFYDKNYEHFGTVQVQDDFIKLLTDNFEGWEFKNVKNNFANKPKTTLQLL
ncbi:MAG: hypothetical protein ACSHW7_10130 [Patiriisocius sp.]|uniref:hypothetical protein n=1 Tax=Patiriisocius sp. TaxID=2822396 RepID=UPI003EF31BDB